MKVRQLVQRTGYSVLRTPKIMKVKGQRGRMRLP